MRRICLRIREENRDGKENRDGRKTGTVPVLFLSTPRLLRTFAAHAAICSPFTGWFDYHVFNRSSGRFNLFRTNQDFLAFVKTLAEALERYPGVRLLGWCIMGNHWHLLLAPTPMATRPLHALAHHRACDPLAYQPQHDRRSGRSTAGNTRASSSRRMSISLSCCGISKEIHCGQDWCDVPRTGDGAASRIADRYEFRCSINRGQVASSLTSQLEGFRQRSPQTAAEEAALATCIQRSRPFGSERWQIGMCRRLGLVSCMRSAGRPRKKLTMT